MATKKKTQSKSERAQALMRQQQQAERRRNLLVVGAVVVAVAIIAVVMVVISSHKDTTGQTATAVPKNLTGQYDVLIGNKNAPTTLKVYEDFQCPICADFEKYAGAQVQQAIKDGKIKVDYHMVAFLDRSSTTNYSSRALNAGMAVLSTAGPQAFLKFHTLAYANQPAEGSAGLPNSTLISWAVQSGAPRAEVTKLINDNTYHQWVVNATNQMSLDGVNGTPTVYINGQNQGINVGTIIQNVLKTLQS